MTEGFRVPEGEVYQVIESPRGELGYYMVSDGTSKPYRVHIHGPSFGNLQGLAEDDCRAPDRRRDRFARQHGLRVGGLGPVTRDTMTFSPQLEAKFAKLLSSYPPGRQRGALVPMLLFTQDEVGAITQEVIEEIAKRIGIFPLQVEEVLSYYSMLHRQAAGQGARADLHQHQLPADRRRGIVGARLPETGHR